jgi:ribosomal protein S8E
MGTYRTSSAVALLAAVLAVGLGTAAALAGVTVYKNNFSGKAEAGQLDRAQGKHCDKRWRRKTKTLRIAVQRGPGVCGYRPPVEGDSDRPDHDFQAKGKLLKRTPKSTRRGAYLAIAVRVGKNTGYELRAFPKKHKFVLRRSPSGGGGGFPANGTSSAIKGVSKPNVLRLRAVGDKVTARVNGTKVAEVTDSNPGEVDGRKLEVAVGHKKNSPKPVLAVLDDLKLQVPNP